MNIKIVCDSSANVFTLEGLNYATVPMKINAGDREFLDVPGVDPREMVDFLQTYAGKSGSSCPNVQDWLDAFEGSDWAFGITITKNLSGSYNSAYQAAQTYMEEHPDAKVYIFDSLSTGPEMMLMVEKLRQLLSQGLDFDTIREQVLEYQNTIHTVFLLKSLNNLARNGRVHPAVAKIAGVLGIRMAGVVEGGRIEPAHKPRGDKKSIATMVDMMVERGLKDGNQVRISHCFAEADVNTLVSALKAKFPHCSFQVEPTTILCSFYAEEGGFIVSFEGDFNEKNDNRKF